MPAQKDPQGLEWFAVNRCKPDADATVMVALPHDHTEPVWLGFWDGNAWRDIDGIKLTPPPTHWAIMPEGPGGQS